MADALPLVQQLRSDLKPIEQKILGHGYLSALEQGQLERGQLKIFAGQQHHIISSDLRSIALILSPHGTLPSRRFLMRTLQGEAAALEALHQFAVALGLRGGADLETLEPLPAAHAYCCFVAWLALYGSDAELAGAFLFNLPAWGANCRRMRDTLHARYGFAPSSLTFFDLFANMPSIEADTLDIIQNAFDRGVAAPLVHRAARMLQSYELMFWDAMADSAGIALE